MTERVTGEGRRALERRLAEHAEQALDHHRATAPRQRQLASGLLAGGAAPLLGYFLLGWGTEAVTASLLFNVCLAIVDRITDLHGSGARNTDQQEFRHVWAMARYLSGRRRSLPLWVLQRRRESMSPFEKTLFGLLMMIWAMTFLPLYLMASGAEYTIWEIAAGSAVTFFCYFGVKLWTRPADSVPVVPLRDEEAETYMGMVAGALAMAGAGVAIGLALMALGVYRLLLSGRQQDLAAWLEDWLIHHGEPGIPDAAPPGP